MLINALRQRIKEYIIRTAGHDGGLNSLTIEEPKNKKFSDLSTNAAMILAPILKKNPMDIAKQLIDGEISKWPEVDRINAVKPGFINFNIKPDYLKQVLKEVAEKHEKYGFNESGKGISIQMEYVSSNPTGNLHIGHGRWGALGDSLANIYAANSYKVFREYYVNDYGTQAEKFAECGSILYLENYGIIKKYPEDGYPGEIVSLAVNGLISKFGDRFLISGQKNQANRKDWRDWKDKSGHTGQKGQIDRTVPQIEFDSFKVEIINIMVAYIRDTLKLMGVEFDNWFYESSLYEGGNFEKVTSELRNKGLVYDEDGAIWFKSSQFGDDKDRVIIRSGGKPTYFASDILYLSDKIDRKYDILFYIFGADHHGYVDRMKAIGKSLGLEDERLKIVIGQLVKIVKDGKTLKMSRRKGKLYNLRGLIEEVGKDAARYFFSMNSFDTPMDFDIGLAKQKSNQNPVFYVQYAHARIESVMGKILEVKPVDFQYCDFNPESDDIGKLKLENESEKTLAKIIAFYPDAVYASCKNNAPHLITQYLYRLSSEFHYFYNNYRIMEEVQGEEDNGECKAENGKKSMVYKDRLTLILLVRIILQNALKLLGVDAPKKM